MRLITKEQLAVKTAASDDQTRYVLNGVLVIETDEGIRTVATNGRILAMVEGKTLDVNEFPKIDTLDQFPNSAKQGIIPNEAIEKAVKSIPKKTRLDVLKSVAVKLNDNQAMLCATDLENVTPTVTRLIEGHFPNYEQVIPNGTPTVRIGLSVQMLSDIAKIGKDFGAEFLTFEITDNAHGIKATSEIKDNKLTIVAMPHKI